jgi:ABC-type nitrate/sulfonate/bicarbonate transport system substrate-binding protein
MSFRPFLALILLVTSIALFSACGDDDSDDSAGASTTASDATANSSPAGPNPEKVVFMAGFRPQANLPFVGVYVAQELGFFADESMHVEIRHSNPGENFRFLASNEVQFSTADATAVLEKWTGDPQLNVVSLALIGQTGQQGFATLADSGITSPSDWSGKTAGFKGAAVTPDYLAILEANGVDRSSVQEVKVGFEPQVLTERVVDIFPVFISNEPDTLSRLGFETNVVTAADYGAPTLGLTYIAMENYVTENPDIAERFVRAALRGIEWADAHREDAVDIVLQYAPGEDRAHQRFMLITELAMAREGLSPETSVGHQSAEQWQALHDYLIQYAALPGPVPDISRVFAPDLVTD